MDVNNENDESSSQDLVPQKEATPAAAKDPTDATSAPPPPRKVHHVTVCMVPPPSNAPHVWKTVSQMRRQLKDPGYYRWPPHANLLYPFFEVQGKSKKATNNDDNKTEEADDKLDQLLEQLYSATRQVEPFEVVLGELGTFGGKQRGVLWLHPDSSNANINDNNNDNDYQEAPLLTLHKHLEQAFPMCKDQTKGDSFTPHMTLSHFVNLDDALAAKQQMEQDYPQLQDSSLTFKVDRIYLLRRGGDEGQFVRWAEIGLGASGKIERLDPPQCFPDMPAVEDTWVHDERMKLKARRNGNTGRGRGGRKKQQQRHRSRGPRVPDTPEEIAAKRTARKAKREQLEQEPKEQGESDC